MNAIQLAAQIKVRIMASRNFYFFFILILFPAHELIGGVKIVSGLSQGDNFSSCIQFNQFGLHEFRPHCQETIRRSGHSSEMSYDLAGLRNKNLEQKTSASLPRILILGSSEVSGPGLPEQSTIPSLVEVFLAQSKAKTAVINGGIDGYSTVGHALKIDSLLKSIKPQIVVFKLEMDWMPTWDYLLRSKLNGTWSGLRLFESIEKKFRFFLAKSAFLSAELKSFFIGIDRLIYNYRCAKTTNNQDQVSCLSAVTLTALKKMRDAANENNAIFYVYFEDRITNNLFIATPDVSVSTLRLLQKITPEVIPQSTPLSTELKRLNIPYFSTSTSQEYLPSELALKNDDVLYLNRIATTDYAEKITRGLLMNEPALVNKKRSKH